MSTETLHTYTVYRDGTHHAILTGVERKYTYFIPMEAAEVRVAHLAHEAFRALYAETNYPVRRAAEVFLHAPDKVVSPEARVHLERVLADPAYAYDSSLFPPLLVTKDKAMATKKNAADVAGEIAAKPKNKKEALAAAAAASAGPVGHTKAPAPAAKGEKAAPAAKKAPSAAAKEPKEKKVGGGRAPALETNVRFKLGEGAAKVRSGFMKEFTDAAEKLEKTGKGSFLGDKLLEVATALPGAEGRDAGWIRNYLVYGAAAARSIFVPA